MATSVTGERSLGAQILRNFVLWLVFVPLIIVVLSPIGTAPLPDAEGWKRIAMFAMPVVLVGAVIDALAERSVSRVSRAYGRAFATSAVIFVLVGAGVVAEGWQMTRLLKGLLTLPVVAMFLAVPQWTRDKYITPTPKPSP